ncbi:proto-oncoprotein tyrosine-protein kinase ROS [Sigmodon hispidus]
MTSIHRLTPKPVNAVILGCIWISVVQCTVLSSCLTSCVTNLGRQLDTGKPYNLSEACIQGCQFWNSIDQEKCALKCNDTYATVCERESCEVGCSTAEGTYEEEVLESTALPTAPFASSIGRHGVTLRWNPANISGVKYIIQWKYVQLPGSWTYTETVSKLSYVVEPLHPFTEYIFRVVWIFTAQLHLHSPPSPSYRTHPYGVPETSPFIMKIESSSPDTVEVSWAPPHFPGGPILGYNLRLISKIQKLDSGTQRTSFQFYSTLPNTTYRFSIAAVNEVGEGPEAESVITTPSPAEAQEEEQWLFLSRKTSLRKRSLKYLVEESHCLWSDTIRHNITGIAVNVHQQVVYFSEETFIWMKEAVNMSDMSDLRTFYRGSGVISSISIDWLYQRMYFIMDKLVYVCDLENCSNFEEITPLSITAPQKVVVDSYNGYVFYLLSDGIYRVKLPLPSGRHTEAVRIVESSTLKDFAVKPQSKRIIYFNDTTQVFMSTFLDGSAFHRVLPWVPLKDVKSFACENNDFLITDGKAIFQQDSLSFNEFIVGCDLSHIEEFGFGNLVISGSSTQSYPLPDHPQDVSVLFGSREALVQWKPPAPAIGAMLSSSAWQNWTYEVKVSTQDLPKVTQVFSDISGTMLNVPGLQSATKYMVSVRASSPKGPGPWSDPSVGTTLVPATEPPFIMAVKEDGLWSKPLSSFGPGEFLSPDVGNVSDMDWYNNSLYYSDTKGNVYVRPLNGMDISENYHIPSIAGAGALAFEWLGHFLYWAGKTYVIQRQSVLTGHTDIVAHVKLLVNDMAVDSVGGYLYWTTLYSVESTRLNGESSLVLQAQPWLSGKKVIALTLDLSDGLLYWLVQDNQCIHLYAAVLRGQSVEDATITEFAAWSTSEISQNALMYYSGRLFWINGFRIITAQEIGQRTSVSVLEPAKFNQFTIIQTSLKPLPGNFSSTPKVIPDSIQESSFRIEEHSSNFQVLWNEPPAVDWGIVFYSVEFNTYSKFLAIEQQSLPMFTVEGLEPYALFNLSVTPYTYWGKGQKTSLSLRAPESVPSAPENPRIFILSNGRRYATKNEVVVEFRWNKPKHENGVLTKFEIFYYISKQSASNETNKDWISVNVTPPVMSFQLEAMSPGYIVAFQVRVFTSKGPGPFSDTVISKTSEIKPFPYLISLVGNKIMFLDMDQDQAVWTFSMEGDISTVGYTADDEMGYFVQGDSLFLLNLHNRSSSKILQDPLVSDVAVIAVDWIARHLYFALKISQDGTQIFDVDLEHKVKSPRELKICKRHSAIISFSIYPLLSRLYWTEVSDLGHQMFYCGISSHVLHHIPQPKASNQHGKSQCSCNVTESELGGAMTVDTSDPKRPCIYFTKGQEIWAMDLEGCQCWKVIMVPAILGKRIVSLTVDAEFVYWIITTKDNTQIYQAEKRSRAIVSQLKAPGIKHILAYSSVLQPFPDKAYLSLASDTVEATILNATNTSLTLKLPPAKTNLTWPGIISPTPTYLIYYTEANRINNRNGKHRMLESQENVACIEGLQPFSTYVIQVAVKNYYSDPLEHLPLGKEIQGKTKSGVPGAVCHINATVLSDTSLHIVWTETHRPNGPKESVRYQLVMSHLAPIPETPLRQSEFPSAKLALLVTKLSGGRLYVLKVLACHAKEMWCTESPPVTVNMFDTPEKPSALVPENTSLQLDWKASSNINFSRFWFELQKWKYNEFYHVEASCSQGPVYVCNIEGLQPYTPYNVRVVVVYVTGENSSSDPESFKTKAGVPSKPGIPKLLEGSKNSIQWEKAEDNGSRLMYYMLEIRKSISNDSQNQSLRWKMVFNGSCSIICTWKSKILRGTFQFRAVAVNNIGFGEYSGISEDITLVEDGFLITETSFILTIIVGIFLVATVPLTFVWHRSLKHRKVSKEELSVLNEDNKELAELQGLAAGVGLANACYAVHTLPTQEEIENLPAFPREHLSLRLLLGSGAFGEVYEGTAVDILGLGSGEVKVAVKTLKKGSTDHEKIEFLKEAHLMSKFNHPNILKQLGVCLLSEPQYIILELMEGGDLLSYLRKARGTTFHGPLLTLVDLVELCVDISKGCVYLEQMHFIHRDLAARNCLVSVKDYTSPRIVKIGDFGLAREIYKNDYYRKKGEGLLPVRWMAPENLMDGIFTSQSDVWSFGILVWEILTLGHQPYPAHSNLDVLNYVQEGGRLEPPRNCPDDLWNLMSQCWAQEPDQRPTFHNIQDQLQLFRNVSLNKVPQCGDKAHASGVTNKGFEGEDEMVVLNSDDAMPVTLMETKNQEGLSYLVLATKCNQGEENPEAPLGPKDSGSCGLKEDEKQPHADKDCCPEPQVAHWSPGQAEGLNYVSLTHSGHGDVSD